MGLDATVYCNCFEAGTLKELPPCPLVFVSDDGSLDCRSEDFNTLQAFDHWLRHRACNHPSGILLHHRIGNLAEVGLLRSELQHEAVAFPILLNKVLYSGAHAGDYLTLNEIADVLVELEWLGSFVCSQPGNHDYVVWFRRQMIELTEAAARIGKPISF